MSALDDPGLFGRQWAATYDDPGNPDPAPTVEFLAGLADGGPALELVELLRAKPGGDAIPVTMGDCLRNVARVLAPDGAFVIEDSVEVRTVQAIRPALPVAGAD